MQNLNLWEQVAHGGLGIVAILFLSILALTVIFERLWRLRAAHIVPPDLERRAIEMWRDGRFEELKCLPDQEPSTLARIIAYLAVYRQQPMAIVSTGAGDMASIELRRHQNKAYALAVVATVAPIVGLLGTVVGMIESFHVIAFSGAMGDPTLLAGGISKALINTAAGLAVALPALAMHHYFKSRVAAHGLALEQAVNALLHVWFVDAVAPVASLQVAHHAH